ncbi:hypothetical protein DYB37_008540 [Aphanomyces astaci]|uniref:MIT domain-containing protein n=1 Tax=Aphanomyces astaci TaxID=112090 RepID=A0A418EWW2_APHAT|nr:hypothetical protein DYB35_003014 [Aphanomyces astaci]RHZ20330.1 hypothetical protein DYB37_008540 [Aphanomyces astaci]
MAKERGRDYAAAVDAYVDAGDIFTEIGRNELDPATQRTLKKKAFSLLQRAEALADWLDSHAAPSISEATNVAVMASAEAETEVQATEKHIEDMKQELKQLKYTSQIMKADDASDLGEATKASVLPEESALDSMKRAVVNEIHGLLKLPEISTFRQFEPLGSSADKEQYAQDLKAQVDHLHKELQFEKASHLLATAMRKHKYSKLASDVAEQQRLQAEVAQLRQELQVHQATLEVTRHSIVQITQEKLRVEAESAQQVQSLQSELQSLAKDTTSSRSSSRVDRTKESRMQWFQGPRGLGKKDDDSEDRSRRQSEPSVGSPRHQLSDTEGDSSSIWL